MIDNREEVELEIQWAMDVDDIARQLRELMENMLHRGSVDYTTMTQITIILDMMRDMEPTE